MIEYVDQLATKGIEYIIVIVYLISFFAFWNLYATRPGMKPDPDDSRKHLN